MRRNVVKVGVAYGVLAWLLMQIGSLFAATFAFPSLVMHILVFFLVLGLPLAIFFAWAFEMTPEGLKRSQNVAPDVSVSKQTGQRLNWIIIGLLGIVIVVLVAERLMFAGTGRVMAQQGAAELAGEKIYDSIAVLPFVNMSDDRDQEFFSDGISEELLNLLAKTKGLRVAARTSSFAFKGKNQDIKGIGEQLDVQTILEGSVRKADTRLRITAQLIEVQSGYHLWSETYDRELTDVFAIQDEISEAIVLALAIHFDGVAAPSPIAARANIEAYEHYLKGRELIGLRTQDDINGALDHFSKAIDIDANYAPAYAGKADAYMLLSDESYGDIPQRVIKDLAEPLVVRALTLDPDLADAHNSNGFLLSRQGRHEEALTSYDRALELRPSFALAHMWRGQSLAPLTRTREAWEAEESAHRIDPLSLVISTNVIGWRVAYREYDRALALAREMEELAPDRHDRFGSSFFSIYTDQRDFSSAHEVLLRIRDVEGGEKLFLQFMGISYRNLGSIREATEISDVFQALSILTVLGRCDEAADRYDGLNRNELKDQRAIFSRVTLGLCKGDLVAADRAMSDLNGYDTSNTGPLYNDEPGRVPAPELLLMALAAGDPDRIAAVRSEIEGYLQKNEKYGTPVHAIWLLKARLKVIDGDFDSAMADLERAAAGNRLLWFDRYDPVLRPISDRRDFKAVFDEVDAHVNAERAELGWGPMEASQ